jgi:hypothetical protein
MHKSLILLLITLFPVIFPATGTGQDAAVDTGLITMQVDTLQGPKTTVWPVLIRSMVVPGWGQIEQEHPARATIFYGLSVYLVYNLCWNYNHYKETDDDTYKQNSYRYAILFAQVYALNILDVLHTHVFDQDEPWPGELFSDTPVKSPWGAVARSAMLPGWGQLYNERYFKSVISFGICFDFARKVYVYNQRYQESGSPSDLERRVVNSWYLGLCYMLNMVDAYVDAYLYNFDKIMDLTLHYSPLYETPMIGVKFEF